MFIYILLKALHSNKESVEAVNALTKASELEQVPSHARFQLANVLLSLNLYQVFKYYIPHEQL